MTSRIVLRLAAAAELEDARLWYEERRAGLGADFIECVDEALERIDAAPLAHPRVHGEVRRVLLRRFPYAVFFVVEPERVVVLAVFHASRAPSIWQGRR